MPLSTEPQRPAALVNEAVVVAAQQQAIRQGGLAAVGPVADVMRVAEPARAPRKAAAEVADLEGTAESRGNRAGAAAEIEERTIRAMSDPDHASIAAEPLRRFRGTAKRSPKPTAKRSAKPNAQRPGSSDCPCWARHFATRTDAERPAGL